MPALPNLPLHSDPACIAFRSLSTSRFLDSVQRLGAGGAGELHSLGLVCPSLSLRRACGAHSRVRPPGPLLRESRHSSIVSLSRMALLLTHHHSAHGFLPSSKPIQHSPLHVHAITPVVSLWGRRHESSLPLKQAQTPAHRVLGRLLLRARPNRWFNSDPTCAICFPIS